MHAAQPPLDWDSSDGQRRPGERPRSSRPSGRGTFPNAKEAADVHLARANTFKDLGNKANYQIEALRLPPDDLLARLKQLDKERGEPMKASPGVSRWDCERGAKMILAVARATRLTVALALLTQTSVGAAQLADSYRYAEAEAQREPILEDTRERQPAEVAAARTSELDAWRGRIHDRIRSKLAVPSSTPDDAQAVYEVVVIPGGELLSVQRRKSSGHAAYDVAIERAIASASPLPMPSDPALSGELRHIMLVFQPRHSSAQASPARPADAPIALGPVAAPLRPAAPRATSGVDAISRFALEIQSRVGRLVKERGESAYPPLAREGRREGTSHVRAEFGIGGTLKGISVSLSSGHAVLDQRAVEMVTEAMPRVPDELRDRDFTVRFPIVFKLVRPSATALALVPGPPQMYGNADHYRSAVAQWLPKYVPPGRHTPSGATAEVTFRLSNTGNVSDFRFIRHSGVELFDASIRTGIMLAQPWPILQTESGFSDLMHIVFRPGAPTSAYRGTQVEIVRPEANAPD
jgi:TonB family protein